MRVQVHLHQQADEFTRFVHVQPVLFGGAHDGVGQLAVALGHHPRAASLSSYEMATAALRLALGPCSGAERCASDIRGYDGTRVHHVHHQVAEREAGSQQA